MADNNVNKNSEKKLPFTLQGINDESADMEYSLLLDEIEQIRKNTEKFDENLPDSQVQAAKETNDILTKLNSIIDQINGINKDIKTIKKQLYEIEVKSTNFKGRGDIQLGSQNGFIRFNAMTVRSPITLEENQSQAVNGNKSADSDTYRKEIVIESGSRRWGPLAVFGEVVFYFILVLIVCCSFFISRNKDGRPATIAGYSAFTVLTGSMESEIPQGSLIITEKVDVNTLAIGDDITFMANQTTTVTHRIVGIIENYAETGERAFETQGVMNEKADKDPVAAVNVVGKVIYHSKTLGNIMNFIIKNWPLLLFFAVVVIILLNVLKHILKD